MRGINARSARFRRRASGEYVALIAEIKGASPGYGEIRQEYEPVRVAQTFAANGASALAVATDRIYYGGEPNNMKAARVGTLLPLLRTDFIIDQYQVFESRAWQADAILLSVSFLEDAQLRAFRVIAESLGMSVLVLLHDERELERALKSDTRMIGINNRNFTDFSVDLATMERLAPLIPSDRIVVSSDGISSRAEVECLARSGIDAVLVGKALMRAEVVGAKVKELVQVSIFKPPAKRN